MQVRGVGLVVGTVGVHSIGSENKVGTFQGHVARTPSGDKLFRVYARSHATVRKLLHTK